MSTVLFTCPECQCGIHVYPEQASKQAACGQCGHEIEVNFTKSLEGGDLDQCPSCDRKDFYRQADFNRIIGVSLYLIPTAICIFWGLIQGILAFFLFWLLDVYLYKNVRQIAICYKCNTIFRNLKNISEIEPFNHEMNDRIVYSDHDFKGKPLKH